MSHVPGTGGIPNGLDAPAGQRLIETGRILVVTRYFPPQPEASGGIMARWLAEFEPASYAVLTAEPTPHDTPPVVPDVEIHRVPIRFRWLRRWLRLNDALQGRTLSKALRQGIERISPPAILAVHPDHHFLGAAVEAASALRIPLGVYLHDTVAEGMAGTPLARAGARLNRKMLGVAREILVINQGMADLFLRKYQRSTVVIPHRYAGPIANSPGRSCNPARALWAGTLYSVNDKALARVQQALTKCRIEFHLRTDSTRLQCLWHGLRPPNLHLLPRRRWEGYLQLLREFDVLVVALAWPDEAAIHPDELETVFCTKAVEYLASGIPVLVHCPANYYLARYFQERECGLVVSSRDPRELQRHIQDLMNDSARARRLAQNGLRCVEEFRSSEKRLAFRDACRRLAPGPGSSG
jgi:hypothetical protein